MTFAFKTKVYVRYYDRNKIWSDDDIIPYFEIEADPHSKAEMKEIYNEYIKHLENHYYKLSETQKKNFKPYDYNNNIYYFDSLAKSFVDDRSNDYCREHYFTIVTKMMIFENVTPEALDFIV